VQLHVFSQDLQGQLIARLMRGVGLELIGPILLGPANT
jgi:hypothetical protein